MEMLHHFRSLLPFIFPTLVFLLLTIKHLKKLRSPKQNLPPGPKKLPLIGNLHQLSLLPHRSFRELAKKHGPIMHLQLGEIPATIISSPEAAEEVLKKHEITFSQRPIPLIVFGMSYGDTGIVFAPYGNHWKKVRKICATELLSSTRVHAFKSVRENEVWNLIESIRSKATVGGKASILINFSKEIWQLSTRITSMAAFGYDCKETDAVISLIRDAVDSAFQIADTFPSLKHVADIFTGVKPKFNKLHMRLDNVLNNIINEHIARKPEDGCQEDLLDVLLRLHNSNEHPISMTSLKATVWEILSTGTDTSSTTIDWAMSELMRNPDVMKKAQEEARRVLLPAAGGKQRRKIDENALQDLVYLRLVIKETLRLHPPVALAPRQSRERCQVSGYDIPAKALVLINVSALGSNPEWWGDDADKFKPERFDGSPINYNGNFFHYLPFGSGRRICPGMTFANAVMELVLGLFLCHFDWKLPDGIKPEEVDMAEEFGITALRKNPLYLIATPI